MRPTLFLRIASVLTFLHAVLHTVGGVLSPPAHGAEEVAVIETMKAHRFDFMGSARGYWDFFFGYGLIISVTLLVLSVLFWYLGSIAKNEPQRVRGMVGLFFLNFFAIMIISWRYFFAGPVVTELLIAVSLALAWFTSRPRTAA